MMVDPVKLPVAGKPMSDAQLRALLEHLWLVGTLTLVVTVGDERVGHAVIQVTDVTADQRDEAVRLVASTCRPEWEVHHLCDGDLVSVGGTRDE